MPIKSYIDDTSLPIFSTPGTGKGSNLFDVLGLIPNILISGLKTNLANKKGLKNIDYTNAINNVKNNLGLNVSDDSIGTNNDTNSLPMIVSSAKDINNITNPTGYQLDPEGVAARDWQERMSNTSHQREVADLIAAGLNPVLSANSGAASYSGATGYNTEMVEKQMANSLAIAKIQAAANLGVANISATSAKDVAKMYNDTNSQLGMLNTAKDLLTLGAGKYMDYALGKTLNRAGQTTHIPTGNGGYVNYYSNFKGM